MIKTLTLSFLMLSSLVVAGAADKNPTPTSIVLGGNAGSVIPTCDFFDGENAIPLYGSASLKYLFNSSGDKWQHIAYGMPYYGVGVQFFDFGRKDDIGTPNSLYLVQGATIHRFTSRLALNYELNLGLTSNWKPYDPFKNPTNIAIGSILNTHVAANVYLKWYVSKYIDLHLGGSLFHASNGSSRQPNHGINTASVYFEMGYNFNRDQIAERYDASLEVPKFDKYIEHDVQYIISSKNVKSDATQSGIPNGINESQFSVFGFNYYSMMVPNYKYKYGLGVEALYDGSSNAKFYRKLNPADNQWYQVTEVAPFHERLSLGLSVRGEIVMPYYSIFANIGYSVIQPNKAIKRLYQSVGVKIPLRDNIYGTFGIRAINFSQAQFLYWSVGYTFNKAKS